MSKNKFPAKLFENILRDWISRNKDLLEDLKYALRGNLSKSDISYYLKELKSNDNFGFLEVILQPGIINDKKSESNLNRLRDSFQNFKDLLEKIIVLYCSGFAQGIEIARASFNYYTINKISKNFDKNINGLKENLSKPWLRLNQEKIKFLDDVGFNLYLQSSIKKSISEISLETLYQKLKEFKSQTKPKFLESVQKQELDYKILMDKYPLFYIKENNFKKFEELTKKIKKFSTQKNQSNQRNQNTKFLDRKIDYLRKKRGGYFQYSWGFSNYVKYCNEIYKPIAQEVGKIKVQIRAIEQEKIEARLLKYWAHILRKENNFYLLLIPKEKRLEFKKELENIAHRRNGEYKIYTFNSLTLRALNKLIRRNLDKEQLRLKDDAVNLYKEVLSGKYDKLRNLDFGGFENEISEIIKKDYKNEEEFRIALEKVAYKVFEKNISNSDLQRFQNRYGAILSKISSYDFERKVTNLKDHTQLWIRFWNDRNMRNNFPIRLNPEIRIFYRLPKEQADIKKSKNRFSQERFFTAFSFTENSAQQRVDLSFLEEKEIIQITQKFNQEVIKKFVEQNKDNLYFYGIDRGQQELATLCLVSLSEKENYRALTSLGEVKYFFKPIFPEIEVYKFKDDCLFNKKKIVIDASGKEIELTLYKNPSYFVDDEGVLDVVKTSCIDLTTAKLIKGKIILNGDLMTYLKLKLASGKRQIFEKIHKIDSSADIEFDEESMQFKVKSKKGEHEPYQLLPFYNNSELEKIMSREQFLKELQNYLNKLRSDVTEDADIIIDKINNLRDAITANMVGIIYFLFQKYPGIISLENLAQKEHLERHSRNQENISRRLEWSLYKKFQKTGLVPPKIRQTVLLREKYKEELKNLGIINFVEVKETSALCPYCGEKTEGGQRREDKFKYHRFVCRNKNCNFTTENPFPILNVIRNSDDVASYNIAKLGYGLISNLFV